MEVNLELLRYPIGHFEMPKRITPEQLDHWIVDIDHYPALLRQAVENLDNNQLDTPYRPEGWTVRQLVHHIADSHMNAFIRTRLALTEEFPTIKAYDQDAWCKLVDNENAPVEWSLLIVEGVHKRWASVLRRVEDWSAGFYHPEYKRRYRLDQMVANYQWHGEHHLAQILGLRERMGW